MDTTYLFLLYLVIQFMRLISIAPSIFIENELQLIHILEYYFTMHKVCSVLAPENKHCESSNKVQQID